ncbi:MAG: flagellar protein FlaG [Colwellia sp.]|nr:flagellar protein FlaG [Colwellia sp.]
MNINGGINSNRADNVEKDIQVNDSSVVPDRTADIQIKKENNGLEGKVDNFEQQDKKLISSEQLKVVAQKLQDFIGEMNKGLEFSVDKDSGRDVIKVIDKNSGDLIKQYPTEEVLDLVAKLSEATGNFINTDV